MGITYTEKGGIYNLHSMGLHTQRREGISTVWGLHTQRREGYIISTVWGLHTQRRVEYIISTVWGLHTQRRVEYIISTVWDYIHREGRVSPQYGITYTEKGGVSPQYVCACAVHSFECVGDGSGVYTVTCSTSVPVHILIRDICCERVSSASYWLCTSDPYG